MTKRAIEIGFVDLKSDNRPKVNTQYEVVSAASDVLENLEYPNTDIKKSDLDLYKFYRDDLPDFTSSNEGFLKIQVDIQNPQDIDGAVTDATFATEFKSEEGEYAPVVVNFYNASVE